MGELPDRRAHEAAGIHRAVGQQFLLEDIFKELSGPGRGAGGTTLRLRNEVGKNEVAAARRVEDRLSGSVLGGYYPRQLPALHHGNPRTGTFLRTPVEVGHT